MRQGWMWGTRSPLWYPRMGKIAERIRRVQETIQEACARSDRDPHELRLVIVTKSATLDEVRQVLDLGFLDVGENHVQQLRKVWCEMTELWGQGEWAPTLDKVRWHMIGHLQRNKVRHVLPKAFLIHSVDTLRLAEEINSDAARLGIRASVLLQVNASNEPQKYGVPVGAATHLAEQIETLPNVELKGLMTMAPLTLNKDIVRDCFARAHELFVEMRGEKIVGPPIHRIEHGYELGLRGCNRGRGHDPPHRLCHLCRIDLMGLYDREYTQEGFESRHRYTSQMGSGRAFAMPAVKWLLIANGVVFLAQFLSPRVDAFLTAWFSVWPLSWKTDLQVWRLVTYQFLHARSAPHSAQHAGAVHVRHDVGTALGTRRFAAFYLGCGMAGGLMYPVLLGVGLLHLRGLVLPRWLGPPVQSWEYWQRVRYFSLRRRCTCTRSSPFPFGCWPLGSSWLLWQRYSAGDPTPGGEAAHLGGMAAGAAYVLSQGWVDAGAADQGVPTQKDGVQREDLDTEVDRILQKVHDSGIHSLSRRDKALLKKATETEQRRRGRW